MPVRLTLGCWALLAASFSASNARAEEIPRIAPPEEVHNFERGGLQIQVAQGGNLIGAPQARTTYGVTGAGLTVCVMDTGINTTHLDFQGRLIGGRNFTTDYGSDPNNFSDGQGHGTNVAGITMANGAVHTGIAPGANVFAMKVLGNSNGGSFAWLLNALNYVRDNRTTYNITVVNMSLGDGGNYRSVPSDTTFNQIRAVIDQLRAAGVVVCVAAGNSFYPSSSQGMGFPGICASTTSVGAVYDANIGVASYGSGARAYTTGPRRITPFSQRLHSNLSSTFKTDMFAPGAAMTASGIGSPTMSSVMHGTSQASPCLAGVALLMQDYYKKRTGTLPTVDQIETWMSQSAETIVDGDDEDDNVVNTNLTFKLVNVPEALERIENSLNPRPTIVTTLPPNQLQTVPWGGTFAATFTGMDVDGDELTLEVDGLPPGATLNPAEETTQASPFQTAMNWTPSPSDVGVTYPVKIRFRDPFDQTAEFSFSLTAAPEPNFAPTIASLASQTIECVDGEHLATLATTVGDGDGHLLTVTWKVNGVVQQTDPNVEPGSDLTFEFDYPHGANLVQATVSDGRATASAGATVTVRDTVDPLIFVAADVTVPNDPGLPFASGVVLQTPAVSDTSGHPVTLSNDAPSLYFVGETAVTWTATDDDGNTATATQKVIVVDQERPVIQWRSNVRAYCDPGQKYATLVLLPPTATDNAPGVTVTGDGRTRFPIGTTKVVWTATDASGNKSTFLQNATVVNRKPKANAGRDVTIFTTSEKGVRVVLDGSRSADPDKHKLRYGWHAKGVVLAPKKGRKTAGTFPVGTTVVTLTVTDVGKLKSTDTMKVTVKLQNGRPRSQGSDANRSFELAAQQAGEAEAKGTRSEAALAGLAYSQAALAYGDAAGGAVRWEAGQPEADALLAYAEQRAIQAAYGEAATSALLSAYAETGDESLFAAYGYAAYGTAYAAADLNER